MGTKRRKGLPKSIKRTIIFSVVGVLVLTFFIFGVIFYPTNVEVVGNNRYTDKQIKEMVLKGPLSWNTLTLSTFKEHIDLSDIAFMESVDVEYLNHNSIRLHTSEKYAIGYVQYQGYDYYFDKHGNVLEREISQGDTDDSEVLVAQPVPEDAEETITPDTIEDGGEVLSPQIVEFESEASSPDAVGIEEDIATDEIGPELSDVPKVTGLIFTVEDEGTKLRLEDESILNSLHGLARMFDKYEIAPDCVEVSDNHEMMLYYDTVRIQLGADANLEEKMTRVAAILPKLEGESGVLHLEDFTNDTQNIIFERDESF